MKPLAGELSAMGHSVRFTARDRAGTCRLLDLHRLGYTKVGDGRSGSAPAKALGIVIRALKLARTMERWKPDVSFGHGSRSLPLASRLLGVPSVTMYDYEWVNPLIFNLFCRRILLPESVGIDRCREAGVRTGRVSLYPGFKENLYLSGAEPDPEIFRELGLSGDRVKILVRPPATTAHYHNPEAEVILAGLLERLAFDGRVQTVWIPRASGDLPSRCSGFGDRLLVPSRAYPGSQMILAMDAVIGGGGTMTREAAILGVPSYTFFRGRPGRVDETLESEGRLVLLERAEDFPDPGNLPAAKEPLKPREPRLAAHIAGKILECARS
jgi:predicted glycosyltransferase